MFGEVLSLLCINKSGILRSMFIDINSIICTPKKDEENRITCTDEHFRA